MILDYTPQYKSLKIYTHLKIVYLKNNFKSLIINLLYFSLFI